MMMMMIDHGDNGDYTDADSNLPRHWALHLDVILSFQVNPSMKILT